MCESDASWEAIQRIMQMTTFPVVIKCDESERSILQHIYPLFQGDVYKIMHCSGLQGITIRVFGSALTMRCNAYSDLDIAIETERLDNDLFHAVQTSVALQIDAVCDIIYLNSVDKSDRLYQEIMKGLVIVEGS